MPSKKRQRAQSKGDNSPRKRKERDPSPELDCFSFPYFANQQLDTKIFPPALALPLSRLGHASASKSLARLDSLNGIWKDEEDESYDYQEAALDDKTDLIETKVKITKPAAKNPYKKMKVPGGRPAMAKRVTADLDSEDEIIVRMKNAKFKEREIAQRLRDENRTNYNNKTIGTRNARLQKKLQEKHDDDLDAELTDWHDGDDEALELAMQQADKTVEKLKADIENKKWKLIAENLKANKPVTNLSQNACKARYQALQDGTAKATPESIMDPDEDVLVRIAGRKAREKEIENDKLKFRLAVRGDPETDAMVKANYENSGWTSNKPSLH